MLNCLKALRIRDRTGDEAYHILEIVEAREQRSTIFCTQFDSKGWHALTLARTEKAHCPIL